MTPNLPEAVSDDSVQVVRVAIESLQSEREAFENFVSESLDTLESLRCALGEQESEISDKAAQLEHKEAGLHKALEQMEAKATVGADYESEIDQLRSETSELAVERDRLRRQLDTATEELSSMANLLELVESAEEELQVTRQKLDVARGELAQKGDADSRDELEAVKQRNAELEREQDQLQRELKEYEQEVSRLTQKAKEQGEELSSYRDRWLGELKGMKSAIRQRTTSDAAEGKPGGNTEAAAAAEATVQETVTPEDESGDTTNEPTPNAESDQQPAAKKSSDPVIGSVLDQLAKLEQADEE